MSCCGGDTKSKKSVLDKSSGRKESLISMLETDDVISPVTLIFQNMQSTIRMILFLLFSSLSRSSLDVFFL